LKATSSRAEQAIPLRIEYRPRLAWPPEDSATMSVLVKIPTPLRTLTQNKESVDGDGASLQQLVDGLDANYPGMKTRLCDETGALRRFINVYINGEDVRFLDGLQSPLKQGDEVSIVPAVAGG
jgi:sulfur-carrier protein